MSPRTVERVLKAKLTGKIINLVGDLLKLAILAERGGVMFEVPRILMLDSVDKVMETIAKAL